MQQITISQSIAYYLWRALVCGLTFAAGMVASRLVHLILGLYMPRMPQQAGESTAIYYLLIGSILLALGILPVARRIGGSFLSRFAATCVFFFGGFAVSTSIESSIYSSYEGYSLMISIFILPVLLTSLLAVSLTRPQSRTTERNERMAGFFRRRPAGEWVWRLLVVVVAFPVVYLVFGILVSPLVSEYYQGVEYGLVIPGIGTIIGVQLARSALFVLVTLPVLAYWSSGRTQLVASLTAAHFVFVYAYDIVLAYQLPAILLVVHGIEILCDSFVYSWLTARLLYVESENLQSVVSQAQTDESYAASGE